MTAGDLAEYAHQLHEPLDRMQSRNAEKFASPCVLVATIVRGTEDLRIHGERYNDRREGGTGLGVVRVDERGQALEPALVGQQVMEVEEIVVGDGLTSAGFPQLGGQLPDVHLHA